MAVNGDSPDEEEWFVEDDEEYVNKRKKERILSLREDVDEWKREVLTEMRLGQMDEETAMLLWGDRVRDYLLAIEPLFYHDGMPGRKQAYLEEKLGYVVIEPPQQLQQTEREAARAGARGRGHDLLQDEPLEPARVLVEGLKTVIERESATYEWDVQVRTRNPGPDDDRRKTITVEEEAPLNRTVLQNAVRVADEFLQGAGIGLKLSLPDYNPDEPGL